MTASVACAGSPQSPNATRVMLESSFFIGDFSCFFSKVLGTQLDLAVTHRRLELLEQRDLLFFRLLVQSKMKPVQLVVRQSPTLQRRLKDLGCRGSAC